MVVACATLDLLIWSNEGTLKFNDYVTQLIHHYKTLERVGQAKTDGEKVMKLLSLMSTSNVAISTQIKLNQQGIMFQNAIVSLSTSIVTIFPLVNAKGHRALVSETETGSEVSNATHNNGLKFFEHTLKTKFNIEENKFIPKQVRKRISFAKRYKFDNKQAALKPKF